MILVLWGVCLVYTVGYCYLFGYLTHESTTGPFGPDIAAFLGPLESFNRDPSSLSAPLNLGFPDWIFYGVLLPWLSCIFVMLWFCYRFFSDDDLGSSDV